MTDKEAIELERALETRRLQAIMAAIVFSTNRPRLSGSNENLITWAVDMADDLLREVDLGFTCVEGFVLKDEEGEAHD